jgi:GNAT superfamily N-acetyltransferase
MESEPAFRISPVRSKADLAATIHLFSAYVNWLGLDLTFQDFDAEMAAMPGKYAPPTGELLLARNRQGEAVGCVALRPMDQAGLCEMKRLYVCRTGRSLGVGKALISAIIGIANRLGYHEMRLDTLPSRMAPAISLYKNAGFDEIPAYYSTPLAETVFLARKLDCAGAGDSRSHPSPVRVLA